MFTLAPYCFDCPGKDNRGNVVAIKLHNTCSFIIVKLNIHLT